MHFGKKKSDTFVDITYREGKVVSISFSGHVFMVDTKTGIACFLNFLK